MRRAKELGNKSRGFTGLASRGPESKNARWRGGRMGVHGALLLLPGLLGLWPPVGEVAQVLLPRKTSGCSGAGDQCCPWPGGQWWL